MSDWIILGGVAVFLVAGAFGQARRARNGTNTGSGSSSGDGGNSSYGGDGGDGGGGGDGD